MESAYCFLAYCLLACCLQSTVERIMVCHFWPQPVKNVLPSFWADLKNERGAAWDIAIVVPSMKMTLLYLIQSDQINLVCTSMLPMPPVHRPIDWHIYHHPWRFSHILQSKMAPDSRHKLYQGQIHGSRQLRQGRQVLPINPGQTWSQETRLPALESGGKRPTKVGSFQIFCLDFYMCPNAFLRST